MIYHNSQLLKELQKFLKLPVLPWRIEAYDIANIQGKYVVGAMAVFENGQPNKSQYRKFKIRNTVRIVGNMEGIRNEFLSRTFPSSEVVEHLEHFSGDTGILKEILTRRFGHHEWQYPDLIVVDGGKAQLNSVVQATRDKEQQTGKKMRIIALTKNGKHIGEKIYIAGKKEPIFLSKLPTNVQNLLLLIDNEVHRFAISYYRKLHRKSLK